MNLEDLEMIFTFLGGLGMFLYGMHIMADGLQKSAGSKLKDLMGLLTKNRLVAVTVGAFITAIIQSSSATTVMVVGFVNAGMMNLTQAVGVIMGANIGTTITAWIVSANEWMGVLKPEFFAPVLLGIGAFTLLFAKSENKKKVGEVLVGFGILFIGLSFMSDAIKPYRESQLFIDAFAILGKNPILAVLAGAIVTAVIQSSSASVGILQTLAANGVVNWSSAVFITLGQNIGTCVTALLSSMGAGKNARRASIIHLLFNTIGTVAVGIIMYIVFKVNSTWALQDINSVQISLFHTAFNVSVTVAMFPFANVLVSISKKLIPDTKEEAEKELQQGRTEEMERRLDRRILQNPAFAIETANREVFTMMQLAVDNTRLALQAIESKDSNFSDTVLESELIVNQYEKLITTFLVEVDALSLTEAQHESVKNLFYTISDAERIGDYAEHIVKLSITKRLDKIEFSNKGNKDLEKISVETLKILDLMLRDFDCKTFETVKMAEQLEDSIDCMEEELRAKHIQRLSKGKCTPASGVIFLDVISNLERIADHANNIVGYVESE
ncbi:MAG: Na/Pi cotransporter family protein [Eubacteriales bacterium]